MRKVNWKVIINVRKEGEIEYSDASSYEDNLFWNDIR